MPALLDPAGLRETLLGEFAFALKRVGTAAATAKVTTAVHEARKALRRALAILALLSPALPGRERRAIRRVLQGARRGLSGVRDQAVAPATLSHLSLPAGQRETARRVLANAAAELPSQAAIRRLLVTGAARAAAQAVKLEAALPKGLEWESIEAGLRAAYRAARRARELSRSSLRWFHAWRRRSKELGYQLQLVARRAGPRVSAIHGEVDRTTASMSAAVDLLMLRAFVGVHSAGVEAGARGALEELIDRRLLVLVRDARLAGRSTYRAPPRRFAARLTKALRRDLASPAG